jgi:hypothetical protein
VATSQDMRFVLSSANVVPCKRLKEIYSFSVFSLNLNICSHFLLLAYSFSASVVVNTSQEFN